MRILANQTGVQAPDADYPKGRIVNNQTIISEEINGDIVNLFQKLVSLASISENGNPDNETNGYQLLQAFAAYVRSLAASESASGVVERANQTEINTGSDDARYITPLKLRSTTFIAAQIPNLDASKITSGTFAAARIPSLDASKITTGTFAAARIPQATTTSVGGSELATQNEVNTGTDAQKIVCPSTFAGCYAMTTRPGTVTLATQAEVNAGTQQLKVVTPETLSTYIAAQISFVTDGLKMARVSMGTSKDFTTTTVYTVSLPGGITANQVYAIDGIVYNDSGDRTYPLNKINTVTLAPGLSVYLDTGTNEIKFSCPDTAFFDNAEFNGSGTRGYFVIWYV